jgi:ribonuclease HI
MTARYATTCRVCLAPIQPGEEIAKATDGWAHGACAPSDAAADSPAGRRPAPKRESPSPQPTAAGTAKAKRAATRPARPDMPTAADALEVWTDGACSGNPGPGGWAWATRDGRRDSGGAPVTTNQRMEIQAALAAVQALPGPLTVVSDSTYVVNCFRDEWWRGWLARGWTTSARKPVANRDLWEPLVTRVNERGDVAFRWVKGHSGDEMNDLVDRIAVEESARAASRAATG